MKSIINIIICATLCSCVSQIETGSKGGGKSSYFYAYNQVGGKGTGQSSLGTAVAFDGEKSLADVLQAYVARGASLDFVKTNASDNAVKMHKEGEITTRQLAEFQSKVDLAKTSPEVIAAAKAIPATVN